MQKEQQSIVMILATKMLLWFIVSVTTTKKELEPEQDAMARLFDEILFTDDGGVTSPP